MPAISLRDARYQPTRMAISLREALAPHAMPTISLRACYAMSGTEIASVTTGVLQRAARGGGSDVSIYGKTLPFMVAMFPTMVAMLPFMAAPICGRGASVYGGDAGVYVAKSCRVRGNAERGISGKTAGVYGGGAAIACGG
eukprot:695881-Rhodomonas_salina.1